MNLINLFVLFNCTFLSCMFHTHGSSEAERQWPKVLRTGVSFETPTNNRYEGHGTYVELKEPLNTWRSKSGGTVALFDDVFSENLIHTWLTVNLLSTSWRFHPYKEGHPRTIPWTASMNASLFATSATGIIIGSLIKTIHPIEKDRYRPYRIQNNVMRRGDAVTPIPADPDADELTVLVHLNDEWGKNDYGELLLLDDGDILCAVTPVCGRAVIWDSSIGYLTRPPSFNSKKTQFFLTIQYSKNVTMVTESTMEHQKWLQDKKVATTEFFKSMKTQDEESEQDLDVHKHLYKNFTTPHGQQILIFDDLFYSEDLEKIRAFVPQYGDFYFDDSFDEDSDNVQWISAFQTDNFIQSRMWPVIQRVAEYASGKNTWFPYDVSCNVLRAFDSTQDHYDCEYDETEWTFLLYLTKNWTLELAGETAYYADVDRREFVTSVFPKYGRAVIFEGIIPHSARPPSPLFLGARLSFAVKLSENVNIAREKMFKQEFAHEEGIHQESLSIINMHSNAEFHDPMNIAHRQDKDNGGWGEKEKGGDDDRHCLEAGACREPSSISGVKRYHKKTEAKDSEEYEFMEDEFADLEKFPEIKSRKEYILNLISEHRNDAETLAKHYQQFLQDLAEISQRYTKILENYL